MNEQVLKEEIAMLESNNRAMQEENRQLKQELDKTLTRVSVIEHNLEKYDEIGTDEHFDYALHKTWELKKHLFNLLNNDKEKQ